MSSSSIPEELRRQPRWVVLSPRGDGWEPLSPKGKPAYVLKPATWGTFEQADSARSERPYSQLGFALTADCPYSVIEVHGESDDVVAELTGLALEIVEELTSYAERFSMSSDARIFVRGKLPCGTSGAAAGNIVVYDRLRFAPVTGWHVPDAPTTVEDGGDRLLSLIRRLFPGVPPIAAEAGLSDAEVIAKATKAHGEKFTSLLTYDDISDDDRSLVLARYLAFWTRREPEQMRRLLARFCYLRGKRMTYLEPTIRKALEGLPSAKEEETVEMIPADDVAVEKAVAVAQRIEGAGWPLWRAVFKLAQHLRPLGGDPRRLRPAVDDFARRLQLDGDECWGRFRQVWDKVLHPDGLFDQAVQLAEEEPVAVPDDYSEHYRRLASIAYHLSRLAEDGVFFLAQPKLAKLLGKSQRAVSTMIGVMRTDGYLEVVEEDYSFGHKQGNRAKTYRWRG